MAKSSKQQRRRKSGGGNTGKRANRSAAKAATNVARCETTEPRPVANLKPNAANSHREPI